jgi:predicted PurR-regulated permease PerM
MITSKTIANGILRSIGVLVLISILLYFLYQIQAVIVYLIVSLILTLIGKPIMSFLKTRLKFPNVVAAITTLIFFFLLIAGFISLFIPLILSQSESLSLLNTTQIEHNINQLLHEIVVFLDKHNIDSTSFLKETNISSKIDFNFVPELLNTILNTISSFGVGLAAVFFITFFFLKDKVYFIENLKKLIPDAHETSIINSLDKINHLLSRYFIGLLLQLGIVFVLYLIVLSIFGISNAFIIAFLCAVLNIIPYVGPLIASLIAAVLTMISHLGNDFQSDALPTTIYILIGFWIVQLIDNNLSQPIIFSKSVSSHPLEIFLVILIAGFLSGILGMVIAVPLYTILKVIGKEFFPNNIVIQLITKNI